MNLETRLRAGIAMLSLSLIILTFFFFQQQDELKKCKSQDSFISGGDIEKAETEELNDDAKILSNLNGRIELGINDYLDSNSHNQMKEDKDFISKFSKKERLVAVRRIEELKKEYDYPLTSWIFAFEFYKKENPKIAEEIDEFIGHLTE